MSTFAYMSRLLMFLGCGIAIMRLRELGYFEAADALEKDVIEQARKQGIELPPLNK